MAAPSPDDPLSRLIGIESVQSSHPTPLPDGAGTDMAVDVAAGVDATKDTEASVVVEAHEKEAKDLLTFADAAAPQRPRASRRSITHRRAVGDGQTPVTPATDDDRSRLGGVADVARTTEPMNTEVESVAEDAGLPEASVPDETSQVAVLDELAPTIDRALAFAERWDASYRPEIFRVALGALLGGLPAGSIGAAQTHGPATGGRGTGGAQASRGGIPEGGVEQATGEGLAPTVKLARKLGVDAEDVERAVMFGDDNRITVIGHVEGKTKKELQTKYALVYCFIKEIALGDPLADVEELRTLCVEHGCYDLGNFTGNFRKDVKSGLLREIGAKGSRVRRYRLAKKGLDEAAALLREMVEQ